MRGERLRAARVAQKVSLKRIAASLNVDASYLSHVEHGRRAATPDIIAAYSEQVKLGADPRGDLQQEDPFVHELIGWFRTLDPYPRRKLPRLAGAKLFSVHNALDSFRNELVNATPLDKNNKIVLVWESASDYTNVSKYTWLSIMAKIVATETPLKVLFSPSPRFDTQEMMSLIRESTRCIQFKELTTFDSVGDLNFSHFPIDFFYVSGHFALLCFAGREYRRKNILRLKSCLFEKTEMFDLPLGGYLERIESYRDQRIKLYFTTSDLTDFFQEYAATEELGGPRYLFQSWPGSNDRPPEDYEAGSGWWRYYKSLDYEIDVDKLAKTRKRAWDALRRRMKSYPVRHICSRQVLEEWARTGFRPGFGADQDPNDRINQIQYMITTLKTYPKCEIAIVDHDRGRELGWAPFGQGPESKERNLSWLVQGTEKVIVEGHAPDSGGVLRQYQCVISDGNVAGRFEKTFERTWDRLPKEIKDGERTIEFLQNLSGYLR